MRKPQVKLYRDASRQWRGKVVAANNKILVVTSEAYHNKTDCVDALKLSAIAIVKGLF